MIMHSHASANKTLFKYLNLFMNVKTIKTMRFYYCLQEQDCSCNQCVLN
jgi:hypothetical protein